MKRNRANLIAIKNSMKPAVRTVMTFLASLVCTVWMALPA